MLWIFLGYNVAESRQIASKNSNFVRIMRFYLGSWLRGILFSDTDTALTDDEIKNITSELSAIKEIVGTLGVEYFALLVSPYSELSNTTYLTTIEKIQTARGISMVSPEYTDIKAADIFYPLDGQFNEAGASYYGGFIVDEYFTD